MNTIDTTKKYKTRDGRAVTGLRPATKEDGFDSGWEFVGRIHDSSDAYDYDYVAAWTAEGRDRVAGVDSPDDLVLAEDQDPAPTAPGLIVPTEYTVFVAAVKANFVAGTFATATQEQFDAWLESLTPSLRA